MWFSHAQSTGRRYRPTKGIPCILLLAVSSVAERTSADCIMMFALPPLDGISVCCAVDQFYYLHIKHMALKLDHTSHECAMIGIKRMGFDPSCS